MQFLVVTSTLLLSAIRKRLYTTILISVLAPVLLLVVLFSIPDLSSLNYVLVDTSSPVLIVSSVKIGEDCYSATLLENVLVADNSIRKVSVLATSSEPSRLLGALNLTRHYNYTSAVVLPRDLYSSLREQHVVTVQLDQITRNYTVAGLWSSNIVLLVDINLESQLDKFVCLISRREILLNILRSTESNLLSTAMLWILALSLVYTPVIYAAQRRVIESLRVDLRVLVESGVSARKILLSTITVLTALHVIVVLYVCALSIVLVYTAWSLLSYILPLPLPTLRTSVFQLLLLKILLGFLTAYLACRGVVE